MTITKKAAIDAIEDALACTYREKCSPKARGWSICPECEFRSKAVRAIRGVTGGDA